VLVALAIAVGLAFGAPKGLEEVVDYRIKPRAGHRHGDGLAQDSAAQRAAGEALRLHRNEGCPVVSEARRRKKGGSPAGFDSIAAQYLARHGMPVRDIVAVMQQRVKAATFLVRTYTPMQKRDTGWKSTRARRKSSGYHRLQDEKMPGPRLEQPQAQAWRWRRSHLRLRRSHFEVKEALNFQQRRAATGSSFQEKTPLVADAWRRVSVFA